RAYVRLPAPQLVEDLQALLDRDPIVFGAEEPQARHFHLLQVWHRIESGRAGGREPPRDLLFRQLTFVAAREPLVQVRLALAHRCRAGQRHERDVARRDRGLWRDPARLTRADEADLVLADVRPREKR